MTTTDRLRLAIADRYILKGELGAGGMATVYLAEDVRHHRPVALKVLRPELAAVIGAERFLKEIETTANLQHPHILPLFDSGEVDGTVFYVMPFIEGETLRDRIARDKQLPVEDALRIAKEVASALDYAHRRGVIHRDIKPENILLHDGTALVADFGIALAASKTGNARMTETGMSLGTPHYMSPEQAMGEREITARADVYALGCVLYEMLTGEPPFNGPTAQAIVARVLTDAPRSARGTRATVPPHVDAAIVTALSKLPADRFGTAAEFAAALSTPSYGSMQLPAAVPPTRASRTPWIIAATASAIAVAALGAAAVRTAAPDERPVVRSKISLNQGDFVLGNFTLARDGQTFVVEANNAGVRRLMLRRLAEDRFISIMGTENARFPELTPDGRRVTFNNSGTQQIVPIEGGTRISIGPSFFSSDWHPDGRIVFTKSYNTGLSQLDREGGESRELSTPDSATNELGHWHPQFLADGRHVIFSTYRTPVTDSDVEIIDLKTGERTVVIKGANYGRVLPSGELIFLRGNSIFAANFDASALKAVGQPVEVLKDVAVYDTEARPYFAYSRDGTMIYGVQSVWDVPSRLEWFDRAGRRTPVPGAPVNAVTPALSPDGRFVAYALRGEDWDIWVLDLQRQTSTRLTSGSGADLGPAWGVRSEDVYWSAERPAFHLFARARDASTPARAVVTEPTDRWWPTFTPDGRTMVYNESSGAADRLFRRDLGTAADTEILAGEGGKSFPSISPDGAWMAYTSDESGRAEVYILPYPSLTGRRLQVSSEGGLEPLFVRGGRELLFRSGLRIMSVPFDPVRGELGPPVELFQQPSIAPFFPARSFTATADGQRIMMATRPAGTEPRELVVVSNWFREVREKLAAVR
jgi:eukaryotic-like serine/threonine-protein kinase